ncbi:MAG: hypothetical protein ABIQ04_03990 [Candidatus Saccharimonadales bacterium]
MSEDQLIKDGDEVSPWSQHRFIIMIVTVIIVSLVMVGSALALYASSGAAQLDLSRPGYQAVRDKVIPSDKFDTYSSTGTLDKQAIDDFRTLFNKSSKQVIGVDSYGGDVLSDQSLQIDPPASDTPPSQ